MIGTHASPCRLSDSGTHRHRIPVGSVLCQALLQGAAPMTGALQRGRHCERDRHPRLCRADRREGGSAGSANPSRTSAPGPRSRVGRCTWHRHAQASPHRPAGRRQRLPRRDVVARRLRRTAGPADRFTARARDRTPRARTNVCSGALRAGSPDRRSGREGWDPRVPRR